MRKIKLFIATLAVAAITAFPSMADWKQEADGRWWYQKDDGSYPINQWQEINGSQYYFGPDGYMLANTVTPDGKQVGADGACIDASAAVSSAAINYSADSITTALSTTDYVYSKYGTTYHIFEVTNNSPYTIRLNINETAKDSRGNIVGAHSTSQEDIPSGCTVFIRNIFLSVDNAEIFDTTFQVKEETSYIPVIQSVAVQVTDLKDKIVVSATNAGSVPSQFTEAIALFFKNGKLVSVDTKYLTDDDSELKPGATISEQINPYEKYDSVKVHITGRKSNWY